eukprot:m.181004 g.181004  ORF g.181004 m.181004 type:complete len:1075 (+) comp39261_c0_seq1:396-3620(+)
MSILWGEPILDKTDKAIARSTHGIIIVSPAFLKASRDNPTYLDHTVASSLSRKAELFPFPSFTLLPLLVKGVTSEEMSESCPLLGVYQSLSVDDVDDDKSLEHIVFNVIESISRSIQKSLLIDKYGFSTPKTTLPSNLAAGQGKCALPGEPRLLVGRQRELKAVLDSILAQIDICSIYGPPASGKSALAIAAVRHARLGTFGPAQSGHWEIAFVDIREIFTPDRIVEALLRTLKISYSDVAPLRSPDETDRDFLIKNVRSLHNFCVVIDNADAALNPQYRNCFLDLLKEIVNVGRQELTLIVTSCYHIGLLGDSKIREVELKPLDKESACEVMKYFCSSECQPSEADMELIDQEVCEGIPELLWMVSERFKSVGLATARRVENLLRDPLSCLVRMCQEFGRRHFEATFQSLPKSGQEYLHSLALFETSFSLENGACVVGMDRQVEKFATDVIDFLGDYSLVLTNGKEKSRFQLLKVIREFLRKRACLNEGALSAAKERYCYLWLQKLINIQEKLYDQNACKALKIMQTVMKDVKQTLRFMESCRKSDKLRQYFLQVALQCSRLLRVCVPASERVEFYRLCVKELPSLTRSVHRVKLCVCLAEALLDDDVINEAEILLSTPEVSEAISGSRRLRIQCKIIQGRISVEKRESSAAVVCLLAVMCAEKLNKDDKGFGDIHRVLADAHINLQEYQSAVSCLIKALDWCSQKYGKECKGRHPDACALRFRLGYCCFCQKLFDDGLRHLSLALSMITELQCNHLSLAATWYQTSICRLAASGKSGWSEVQNELEQVVHLLEGEPLFENIPLWILAKHTLAKLLVIEGRKMMDETRSEEGLALLEKAEGYFDNLPNESVEGISNDLLDEQNRFRRLLEAAKVGDRSSFSDNHFNLYCYQGFSGLVCSNPVDFSQSLDFCSLDTLDSRDSLPETEVEIPKEQLSTDTPSQESEPLFPMEGLSSPSSSPVKDPYQRYLSGSSASSTASAPPLSVTPVSLRKRLSSITDLGLMCCPEYPSRRLARCSSSLTSFSSFDSDLLSSSFGDSFTENADVASSRASSDEIGLSMKKRSDSVPDMTDSNT